MHTPKIKILYTRFNILKSNNSNICIKLKQIETKLNKLKEAFTDIIITENNRLLIYCLDTLGFHNKIFEYDYTTIQKLHNIILNRIYCDLYKFYKYLSEYIKSTITEDKVLKIIKPYDYYPKYNSVNIDISYNFEILTELYQNIIDILVELNDHITRSNINNIYNKKNIVKEIDEFIKIYDDNINIKLNKITMFFDYILYISSLHDKYMGDISKRIDNVILHIDEQVTYEDTFFLKEIEESISDELE